MTSAIETVYNEFRSEGRISNVYTIDFFETNSIGLSDFKTFKTKEELKLFIELVWQYTNALFSKKRYNETIDKTIRMISIILFGLEVFWGDFIPSPHARFSITIIAVLGIVGTSLYEYYLERSRRKSR